MKISRPQRNLLTRLLLGGTTLLVSVAAWYSYQVVRNLTLESLKKNAFLEVQQGALSIDGWLTNLKIHIQTLANTPNVSAINWRLAEPFLKTEILRFSDISAIAVSTPDGWHHITGGTISRVKDFASFRAAMAGQITVSDPSISQSGHSTTLAINAPIWRYYSTTAAPVGTIQTLVKLDRVAQVVEQLNYGDRSYAFALNSQGEAIVHPELTQLSQSRVAFPNLLQTSDKALTAIAQRMVAKHQGIELTQVNGSWNYVAYLPLKEVNWSVALVIPRENIESPLLSLDMLAGVVAGLTIAMIVVLWRVQAAEQTQLKKNNETLEQRVSERTAELSNALEQLQQSQLQLVQNEKMSSLGQLVAGIAHEINNPINFIHGNLNHLQDYAQQLLSLVCLYQQESIRISPVLQTAIADSDLPFIEEDLPKLLASMRMGTDRIREIVLSLRTFSRMDEAEKKFVDLHAGIDSTLLILQHRLKAEATCPEIEVVKHYGKLPLVECYAGQLNQVIMNILTNAIDALEDKWSNTRAQVETSTKSVTVVPLQGGASPKIVISTGLTASNTVVIRIADNGPGMSETTRQRLFDPFFTTKPVGKGTGLGLSLSYQIITERHNGILKCISEPGQGAEFVIQIPVSMASAANKSDRPLTPLQF